MAAAAVVGIVGGVVDDAVVVVIVDRLYSAYCMFIVSINRSLSFFVCIQSWRALLVRVLPAFQSCTKKWENSHTGTNDVNVAMLTTTLKNL
jgi:hypothetical protein